MRVIIPVVAASALLMHQPAVGHAQDAQTAAEIIASGVEIWPADCGAGGAAQSDWVVITDTTASSGTAIQNIRATAAEAAEGLAICHAAALQNGDLSLRFKSSSVATHQGGGLALRMASPKDYYLVKVDVRRNRALLLQVSNGLENEIVGVDADVCLAHAGGSGARRPLYRLSRRSLDVHRIRQDFSARGPDRFMG
jgi:hypothetical protein